MFTLIAIWGVPSFPCCFAVIVVHQSTSCKVTMGPVQQRFPFRPMGKYMLDRIGM